MVQFNYSHTSVNTSSISQGFFEEINHELVTLGYESDYASFLAPNDPFYQAWTQAMAEKISECGLLVVIGIGGSNLGTQAIVEALLGKSQFGWEKRIFFLDTPDTRKTQSLLDEVVTISKTGIKVALAVISKSGSTSETAALSSIAYDCLSREATLSKDHCVAITESRSKLHQFALSEGWNILPMYPKVGGRYSVFSHVGLLPLAFLWVDLTSLISGARQALKDSLSLVSKNWDSPALIGAQYLYSGSFHGKNIVDHFFFSDTFESVWKWYRQLLWESIGKEYSKDGIKKVQSWLTPTVSIWSTDLHSVGQLYLGGPRDKSFIFVRVASDLQAIVPYSPLSGTVENLSGKTLSELLDAIFSGTRQAYISKDIPFIEWTLQEGSAWDIGYFLQTKMIETVLLAYLFDVNPFDQPNVEDYKSGTRKALAMI